MRVPTRSPLRPAITQTGTDAQRRSGRDRPGTVSGGTSVTSETRADTVLSDRPGFKRASDDKGPAFKDRVPVPSRALFLSVTRGPAAQCGDVSWGQVLMYLGVLQLSQAESCGVSESVDSCPTCLHGVAFVFQMHHPIQMKPADSEKSNGRW